MDKKFCKDDNFFIVGSRFLLLSFSLADSCLFDLILLRGLFIKRDKRAEVRDKGNVLVNASNRYNCLLKAIEV